MGLPLRPARIEGQDQRSACRAHRYRASTVRRGAWSRCRPCVRVLGTVKLAPDLDDQAPVDIAPSDD